MTEIPLRPPQIVMRLRRLGSFHQSRLSFMRVLLRRLAAENWQFSRPCWQVDDKGVGVAVYQAKGSMHTYSLIAYPHDLAPEKRSDRVIAEQWDATFVLFDGVPEQADIERLSQNVPKQEAGRYTENELVLARANRSVRLFDHVVDRLAAGEQPDASQIARIGYLMRTTAVYGSGKFGMTDHQAYADRVELSTPFQAEMLCVYLIRWFSIDIVEHLAKQKSKNAARLNPAIAKNLGIGNATGLGMAPFLIHHPILIHHWISVRETAIALVRSQEKIAADKQLLFLDRLLRAQKSAALWRTDSQAQSDHIDQLQRDFIKLRKHIDRGALNLPHAFDALMKWAAANLHLEAQEMVASLILEPFGELVDPLAEQMSADEATGFALDGRWSAGKMRQTIKTLYDRALACDFSKNDERHFLWYVSAAKLEPRLGERKLAELADYEQPLAVWRDIALVYEALKKQNGDTLLGEFLLRHPEHRHALRRVQIIARHPYGEIADNTIAKRMRPIDLLRCKLSFFGATHFDPRSDRWVRITMYRGALLPEQITSNFEDDWVFPELT